MALLRVFEIHTYRSGTWKIDSVFDDRDLALMVAERVDHSSRFPAVRVVEETFDDESQQGGTRTIYRSNKADKINKATRAKKAAASKIPAPPPKAKPKPKAKKGIAHQAISACLLLAVIVGGGLFVIYLLNTLTVG